MAMERGGGKTTSKSHGGRTVVRGAGAGCKEPDAGASLPASRGPWAPDHDGNEDLRSWT
jgi:hypothetical protein